MESPRPDCICGTTPGECVVGSNIGSREFYDHNDGTNGLRWSCSNEICSPAECEWFNTESCTDLDSETASMKNGDSGFIEKYVRLTCFEGRWIKTPISDCICGSTVNTCQGAAEPRMEENYPDFSTGKNTYSWDCRNDDVCQTVSCSIVSKNKCFDSSGYVHENGSKISRGEGIFKCVDGLWVADSVSNNTTSQSSPITGDVDGNGIVNTVDFSLVKTGKDINGDGVSNALDMGIVKNSLLEG